VREPTRADVFPERNEQAVYIDPVPAGELFAQRLHGLFRRASLNVAPAISHAMHVYVNAYVWLTAGDSEHKVGALRAYAFERQERFFVARQRAVILVYDAAGDCVNLNRFTLMKRGRAYQIINLLRGEAADFFGRAGAREQPARGRQHDLIISSDGDDAGDELLEGGIEAVLRQFKHRGLCEWLDGFADSTDYEINIDRAFCHGCLPNNLARLPSTSVSDYHLSNARG
jgi:hypothetical protein